MYYCELLCGLPDHDLTPTTQLVQEVLAELFELDVMQLENPLPVILMLEAALSSAPADTHYSPIKTISYLLERLILLAFHRIQSGSL